MALTNKLSAIGDAIREKTGKTDLMTLDAMPAEIASITTGGGGAEVEPIVLTGNCEYACAGTLASAYLNLFPENISTNNITNAYAMFQRSIVRDIPIDINGIPNNPMDMRSMFSNCYNLEEISGDFINVDVGAIQNLFSNCERLRYLPNFINCTSTSATSSVRTNVFMNCKSLREVPSYILKLFIDKVLTVTYYSAFYYNTFSSCYALDEVVDMPICGTLTSNAFNGHIGYCRRLKRYTFETNEDGTPKTANWKNQAFYFNNDTGTGYAASYLFNSGITEDKRVWDDASYHALKNDPDWWTNDSAYARYNHDSAVETINSLPDTSAYLTANGGTNTISFKGTNGSKTDGGAINTLTEEEIAVATAKGWTVSFS